jgi:hypothetical protein
VFTSNNLLSTEPVKKMYDYGPSEGDRIVPHTWGSLQKCFGIKLNDDGIAIFRKRYHKLYVSHDNEIVCIIE